MSFTPVAALSDFGGLDTVNAPDNVDGALFALDVDLGTPGVLASRAGSSVLYASSTPTTPTRCGLLMPFLRGGASYIMAAFQGTTAADAELHVVDAGAGTLVASGSQELGAALTYGAAARFGTPSAEYVYASGAVGAQIYRWGGSWSSPAGLATASGTCMAVQPKDNRLVVGGVTASKVAFSDEGDPETFSADNFVELTPGDGESILNAVTWRDLVIVFKQSKYFVFYGNSTDAVGGPVFNYHTVDAGAGAINHQGAWAAPEGVYFSDNRGLWLTTGDEPTLVSSALDGWALDGFPTFMASSSQAFSAGRVTKAGSKVFLTLADTYTLVLERGRWVPWILLGSGAQAVPDALAPRYPQGQATASTSNFEMIYGIDGTIYRMDSSVASDNSNAFTAFYRTGFHDFGLPGREKDIASMRLWGTGTIAVSGSRDFGDLDSATNVTLGSSPDVAAGLHKKQKRGEVISYQFASVSGGAWKLHRAVPNLAVVNAPVVRSA